MILSEKIELKDPPSAKKRVCHLVPGDVFQFCLLGQWYKVDGFKDGRLVVRKRQMSAMQEFYYPSESLSSKSQQWVHLKQV